MLFAYHLDEVFAVVWPIQIAAFLMTCVRKSIITAGAWHYYYRYHPIIYIYSIPRVIPFDVSLGSPFVLLPTVSFEHSYFLSLSLPPPPPHTLTTSHPISLPLHSFNHHSTFCSLSLLSNYIVGPTVGWFHPATTPGK